MASSLRTMASRVAAGFLSALVALLLAPTLAQAADAAAAVTSPALFGIPVDFILFGATLLGVALFHHYVLQVALTGLATIATYKILFTGFKTGAGIAGFGVHMAHEWVLLANLLGLLVGFALLARHFEDSGVPEVLAETVARGLAGALHAAGDHLHAVRLPRQHRRGADRRHGGGQRVQAQGAYRLPCRHRRRFERRWRRLGGRRHDDDHDVAGRRQSARRGRGLCRGRRGAGGVRHPGGAAAAQAHGDQPRFPGGAPHRLGAGRHRGLHPRLRHHHQCHGEPEVRLCRRALSLPRRRRSGSRCWWRCRCASRNGAWCRALSRARCSCFRWSPAPR